MNRLTVPLVVLTLVAVPASAQHVTVLSGDVWTQGPAKPGSGDRRAQETFVGIDVFGGGAGESRYWASRDPEQKKGWDLGATVKVGTRWFGGTATFGSSLVKDVRLHHALAGARFTSPWWIYVRDWNFVALRGFTHVLAGRAHTTDIVPRETGSEVVVGAGFDFALVIRAQVDYVRLNVGSLPKDNLRFFIGAVAPLCLRACRKTDWFNVSGRPEVE